MNYMPLAYTILHKYSRSLSTNRFMQSPFYTMKSIRKRLKWSDATEMQADPCLQFTHILKDYIIPKAPFRITKGDHQKLIWASARQNLQ